MKDYGESRSRFAQLFLLRICMVCAYMRPRYQVSVYRSSGSETIAACDLKIGKCRQLIELMKLC